MAGACGWADPADSPACDRSRPSRIHGNVSSRFAIAVEPGLIAAARAGSLPAQERLYRLFERPGHNLALRLLADPDDAREVLHDAMLKAFTSLNEFRGDCPFWAWLRKIVVNAALMRLRARQPRGLEGLEELDAAGPLPADVPDPGRLADGARVERALAALPAATRTVVWLCCVEGWTHAEIAGALGRSVSFSKSQLARGLARLRRVLGVEVSIHA